MKRAYTHIRVYLRKDSESYAQYCLSSGDVVKTGSYYDLVWRNFLNSEVVGNMRVYYDSLEVTYSENGKPFERIRDAKVELY